MMLALLSFCHAVSGMVKSGKASTEEKTDREGREFTTAARSHGALSYQDHSLLSQDSASWFTRLHP